MLSVLFIKQKSVSNKLKLSFEQYILGDCSGGQVLPGISRPFYQSWFTESSWVKVNLFGKAKATEDEVWALWQASNECKTAKFLSKNAVKNMYAKGFKIWAHADILL